MLAQEVKEAMKAKQKVRLNALRSIQNSIQQAQKEVFVAAAHAVMAEVRLNLGATDDDTSSSDGHSKGGGSSSHSMSTTLDVDAVRAILTELVKQRKGSARSFTDNNRLDMAAAEQEESEYIEQFLVPRLRSASN